MNKVVELIFDSNSWIVSPDKSWLSAELMRSLDNYHLVEVNFEKSAEISYYIKLIMEALGIKREKYIMNHLMNIEYGEICLSQKTIFNINVFTDKCRLNTHTQLNILSALINASHNNPKDIKLFF